MNGVVAVFRTKPRQHHLPHVGFVVAVRVFQEQQVRLLRYVHAPVAKFKPQRQIQVVGKNSVFVGFAIAVGIFQDNDFVVNRNTGKILRVGGHRGYPKPPTGIEVQGYGLLHRKTGFRRKQVDGVPVG